MPISRCYRLLARFSFALMIMFTPQLGFGEAISTKTVVSDLHLTGASRTNRDWLLTYIGVDFPAQLDNQDLTRIKAKLLTSDVFQRVEVEFEASPNQNSVLHIDLSEKWTTIPVIRAAYGGGTPLTVFGLYDTHSFGRLWTLGIQSERYGSAPPGLVFWARAPRWLDGNHLLGIEFWREFRRRTLYSTEGKALGSIATNTTRIHSLIGAPLMEVLRSVDWWGLLGPSSSCTGNCRRWQLSLDLTLRREASMVFDFEKNETNPINTSDPNELLPSPIATEDNRSLQYAVLPTITFDDISIFDQDYEGRRFVGRSGPLFELEGVRSREELEAFWFWLWEDHLNLAWHAFAGYSDSRSVHSQYFLGGFDSIRGLPDGIVYGNHAAYTNLELRQLCFESKYLKTQTLAFIDAGGASSNWENAAIHMRSAAGVGARFSVPQIYRLTFRVDYAWGIDGKGGQGISAGLNQFFQPYRPL